MLQQTTDLCWSYNLLRKKAGIISSMSESDLRRSYLQSICFTRSVDTISTSISSSFMVDATVLPEKVWLIYIPNTVRPIKSFNGIL